MTEAEETKTAGLKDIMKFFNENSSTQFSKEWKELDLAEKNWFKEQVFKAINPS